MPKNIHEIRDPIHIFVRLDSDERKVLNSRLFQRLRHIHQLGLSYLVYPGATHKRFEHSLGVMELASRVFDVVTHKDAITDEIRKLLPEIGHDDVRNYWRRVLRMAALCHDIGHLAFSHAAEKNLLPDGWDHERLTKEIILSGEMQTLWNGMTPPLRPDDVVKLAVGPRKNNLTFSNWEAILSEIIVGDAFGVDRMDYLLRDSYHIGVAYGRFDHYRLIDTLQILPSPLTSGNHGPAEPALGVQRGGLQSAEALLLARYFMYSQVYFHPVRRIYDIHLRDFLAEWLPEGKFSIEIEEHLQMTDNEVTAALTDIARNVAHPGHDAARRIMLRDHFRVFYERDPNDVAQNPEAGRAVFEAAQKEFGINNVRHDKRIEPGGLPDFPVQTRDGRIVSSISISETLRTLPVVAIDYVFITIEKREEAAQWFRNNRMAIIQPKEEDVP